MKKALLVGILLIFSGYTLLHSTRLFSTDDVEIRSGTWPITLERTIDRSGASYTLMFRDQGVMTGVVMDTLSFSDKAQLQYLGKALVSLKNGSNGDIAKFKDYSVKRADKKYDGVWYILRYQWGSTDFQQPEADMINKTIRSW